MPSADATVAALQAKAQAQAQAQTQLVASDYMRFTKPELKGAYEKAVGAFSARQLPRIQAKSALGPTKAEYAATLVAADKLGDYGSPLLNQAATPSKNSTTKDGNGGTANQTPSKQPATAVKRFFTVATAKDSSATALADFLDGGADVKRGADWVDGQAGMYVAVAASGPRVNLVFGRRGLQLLAAANEGCGSFHGARPEMVRAMAAVKEYLEERYPQEARALAIRIRKILKGVPEEVLEAKGPAETDEELFGEGRVVYMDPSEREVELIVNLLAVMVFGDAHTAARTSYDHAQHVSTLLGVVITGLVEFGTPNTEHLRQIGSLVRKTTLASGKFDFRRVLITQGNASIEAPLREVGQKQPRENQDANMRCHQCKEFGHRKANCPNPRARTQPKVEQVKPEQKVLTELLDLVTTLKKSIPGPPVQK